MPTAFRFSHFRIAVVWRRQPWPWLILPLTTMGCTTSKSTTVVEAAEKPGDPPQGEENNQDASSETKADSIQNSSAKEGTCKSWSKGGAPSQNSRYDWANELINLVFLLCLWEEQWGSFSLLAQSGLWEERRNSFMNYTFLKDCSRDPSGRSNFIFHLDVRLRILPHSKGDLAAPTGRLIFAAISLELPLIFCQK